MSVNAVPNTYAGNGGSGIVIVKDPKGTFIASSVWDLRTQFIQKKANNWY